MGSAADTGGTFLELHESSGAGAGEHDGPWPHGGDDFVSARARASCRDEAPLEIGGLRINLAD